MKSVIFVAVALVAVAVAAPTVVDVPEPVKITESKFVQETEGSYTYDFKSEDGISRQETGTVKEVIDAENKPQKVIVVRGSYTYYNEEGKPVTITYYADETGFHAEGEVIPKAPVARI
ncbi:larval cuticle protein 1-like [Trichoplusia ni]|uniref:Larval cuticle protein 1-like n=1 Tax=Trichoplusia ni TaxID=7111 RepID=A0A7E5VLU8_TRINI|nr:larval cuticle protein 1-like [Trichoplusia ni]